MVRLYHSNPRCPAVLIRIISKKSLNTFSTITQHQHDRGWLTAVCNCYNISWWYCFYLHGKKYINTTAVDNCNNTVITRCSTLRIYISKQGRVGLPPELPSFTAAVISGGVGVCPLYSFALHNPLDRSTIAIATLCWISCMVNQTGGVIVVTIPASMTKFYRKNAWSFQELFTPVEQLLL